MQKFDWWGKDLEVGELGSRVVGMESSKPEKGRAGLDSGGTRSQ